MDLLDSLKDIKLFHTNLFIQLLLDIKLLLNFSNLIINTFILNIFEKDINIEIVSVSLLFIACIIASLFYQSIKLGVAPLIKNNLPILKVILQAIFDFIKLLQLIKFILTKIILSYIIYYFINLILIWILKIYRFTFW